MADSKVSDATLKDYRRGVDDGTMKSATPNVVRELLNEIDRLRKRHTEICDALYGQGFQVLGWHLNGDQHPLDSWFEENDWLDGEL